MQTPKTRITAFNSSSGTDRAGPNLFFHPRSDFGPFAAKLALTLGLAGGVAAVNTGTLTLHMAGHIIAMNIAAPALAWLRPGGSGTTAKSLRRLFVATALQLSVFFLWHSPPVMASAMHIPVLRLAMLAGLFMVSTWFWSCIFAAISQNRIESVAALLITGKLVCLVAVLLVFAPRLLYPGMAVNPAAMGDQQLAGLLMLSACPLTYVGTSIYAVSKWFSHLSSDMADGAAAE